MNSVIQDIRYGLKLLRKDGGLTAVVVLSLALGIGANTTIFSIANAFVFRPIPVAEPESLVSVFSSLEGVQYAMTSYPDYLDWRDRNNVFSGLAAYAWIPMGLKVAGSDPAEVIMGAVVSGNYFSVLGMEAHLGRTFLPEEDQVEGSHPVAVIGHGLWRRRFGSDPGVVGKTVRINSIPFTVIGVAPSGFTDISVGIAPDVWVPMVMASQVFPSPVSLLDQRDSRWLQVVGRLRSGVGQEEAVAAMEALASNLELEYPRSNKGVDTVLVEANQNRFHLVFSQGYSVSGFLGMLLVLVGLVLLIACSNIANILLARTARRGREIALRRSLGGSRGRIIRQLLTESVMLSMLAGGVGVLVAVWAVDFLGALEPPISFPLTFDLSLDWRVLAYTAFLSVLAGIVFGLAPAIQTTRRDLIEPLNAQSLGLGLGYGRSHLRSSLVVAQVALSVVLLVSAGLFLKSAANARTIDPGFDTSHVLNASLNLGLGQYDEPRGLRFYREVISRLEALPSVRTATLAQTVPFGLVNRSMTEISVDGYEPPPDERLFFFYNVVGPGYFETLDIPIVRGRGIEISDRKNTPAVAVVNETMARRFWPGEEPIGQTFRVGDTLRQVIGVASDGKYVTLGEKPRSYFYLPLFQDYNELVSLHVRTVGDPAGVVTTVLRELEHLDADLPVWGVKTMKEHLGVALFVPNAMGTVIGVFGFLALALAVTGLFGVMVYTVSQGARELGIRMALGARESEILKLVLGKGFKTTLLGVGIGLVLASAVTRIFSDLLYDVHPLDTLTFVGVPLLLFFTALVACYFPARKAARIDPNLVLKYE